MGPANPEVMERVIDLLRANRLAIYSSAAVRTLLACYKEKKNKKFNIKNI